MAERKAELTATGVVSNRDSYYYGYVVSVVTATAAITITDTGGNVIDVIPIGTAAGTTKNLASPIHCPAGITVTYGASATGTVLVVYD